MQRVALARHMDTNPGLKPRREEMLAAAYRIARLQASGETDLPVETFPETNPFTLAQVMDEDFWPEPPAGK